MTDQPDLARLFADRYTIGRKLGQGGMGAVYLARDIQLDRPVAIKVLPSEFAAQRDLRERFLRETRTAAGFSHPNIVPVFAVEDRGDVLAMAMGYVEGESVAERVQRNGPLSVKETVRLLQDVGYALAYAHGRGVVHRDIKPDNIMLERATGRALVMDFGISRTISAPAEGAPQQGLTRVGEVVGTPEFMSPEQATGDQVDGRSDLYSLGLVAWFACTGELAISGENTHKVLARQLTEVLPPIAGKRSDLPEALAGAIDRLVKKDPAERFATAESLVETIDAAQLAAPEIPVPVRLFQQDGRAHIANVVQVIVIVALLYLNTDPGADVDRVGLLVVGFALQAVMLANIARQARTLRRLGFDHATLRRGLEAILEEGNDARAQGLTVPGVARRRRLRFVIAPVLFGVGVYDIRMGLSKRVPMADGMYHQSTVGAMTHIVGIVAVIISVLILFTDPYRRPILQRMANAFWGSRLGALLMGAPAAVAGPTGTTHKGARASERPAPPAASASAPSAVDANAARFERIESRLDALERDRR